MEDEVQGDQDEEDVTKTCSVTLGQAIRPDMEEHLEPLPLQLPIDRPH